MLKFVTNLSKIEIVQSIYTLYTCKVIFISWTCAPTGALVHGKVKRYVFMNVSSVSLNQKLVFEKETDFNSADSDFSTKQNIFDQVNSQYLSSEDGYSSKSFEESIREYAYESLQSRRSILRSQNASYEKANLVSSSNIAEHEAELQEDPEIQEVDAGITQTQEQITTQQSVLNTLKNSPEVVQYRIINAKIARLQSTETTLVEQITQAKANGEDTTKLETKLASIREEIEKKQAEAAELQPYYDEMESAEADLQSLLDENAELKQKRIDLDPELVRYNNLSSFMKNIMQGDENGIGVNAEIAENKEKTNAAKNLYDESVLETSSFKELLDKNMVITSSARTDLSEARALREAREKNWEEIKQS